LILAHVGRVPHLSNGNNITLIAAMEASLLMTVAVARIIAVMITTGITIVAEIAVVIMTVMESVRKVELTLTPSTVANETGAVLEAQLSR